MGGRPKSLPICTQVRTKIHKKIWLVCELVYDNLGLLRVTTVRIRVAEVLHPLFNFFYPQKKAKKNPIKPID
jgi:hypothetical protein